MSVILFCQNWAALAQTTISPLTWGGTNTTTTSGPSNFSPLPASSVPGSSVVNVTEWNRGPGVAYNAGANRYNSNNWYVAGTTNVSTAYGNGKYVYFTITNNSSTELKITNLTIGTGQASGTGPTQFGAMYQIGSGAATIFSAAASGPSPNLSGTAYLCAGQTATMYLCGWGGTATAGTWSINSAASLTAQFVSAITTGTTTSNSPVPVGGTLLLTGGTASGGTTPYSYSWSGPSSFTSTIQNPSLTSVVFADSGTYNYTVTDNYGCTASNNTYVNIISGTSCAGIPAGGTATPVTTSFCGSGSTTINLIGGAASTGLTYQWYSSSTSSSGPFTAIAGATAATYTTPTLTTTTYYYVTTLCTFSGDSSSSVVGTVSVYPVPTGIATPIGPSTVMQGNVITLSDTSTGYSTSWTSGSTAIATVDSAGDVTGIGVGTTNIYFNVTNIYGCTGTSVPFPVTVNASPYCIPTTSSSGDGVGFLTTGAVTNIASYSQMIYYANKTTTFGISAYPGTTVSYTLSNPSTFSGSSYFGSIWADWNQSYVFADSTSEALLGSQPIAMGGGTYSGTFSIPMTARGGFTYLRVAIGETSATDYTNPCGGGYGSVVDFYVKILPVITLGASQTACLGSTVHQPITLLAGGGASYHIVWNSAAHTAGFTDVTTTAFTSDTSLTFTVPSVLLGFSSTTTYSGTLYATNGVYSSAGVPISVTVVPPPTVGAISGNSTVCVGANDTLTNATTGGTWSSSAILVATITSGGIATGVSAGTTIITYLDSTNCGTASSTMALTVNPLPVAGVISGPTSVCQTASITLSETITGGVWSTSNGNALVSAGVVTGVSGGNDTISYSITNMCGTASVGSVVTIDTIPAPNPITGAASVCVGAAITLADIDTGGTWSTSNGHASVSGGIVTGISSGTDTISYTVIHLCGSTTVVKSVIINPLSNSGSISGASAVCIGSTVTLTDTASGGSWTAINTTASVTSGGIVSGVTAGIDSIIYSVTTICGTSTTSFGIAIDSTPVAGTITGTSTVCVGTEITLSDIATGGVWSASNAHASVASGVVTGLSVGTDSVLFTVINSCGSIFVSHIITVNPVITTVDTISGTLFFCVGASTTLSETTTGGVWSLSNGNATILGGIVNGVSAGTDSVYYSVSTSCGSAVAYKILTINPLPYGGTITGNNSVCIGATDTLSNSGSVGSGSWSASNSNVSLSGSIATGISAGTVTISYSVTNSCGGATTTYPLTVNALPDAGSVTGVDSVCAGSAITLTDLATGGVWTASNSNASVTGGIIYGVSAGIDSIIYSVTTVCGTASAFRFVTVNPMPNSGTITGTSLVCIGSINTLADTSSGGLGTWSASNTNVSLTGNTATGITAGNVIISYSVTNICGNAISTFNLSVNALPNAGAITGMDSVCAGSSVSLTDLASGGVWTTTNGLANVSSGGIVSGISQGADTIKYSVTNTCGTDTTNFRITVNPLPDAGTISGLVTLCTSTSLTLTETVTGGTWGTSNGDASVSGGIVTGISSGIDTIYYSQTNNCGTASSTKIITVNGLPNAGIISGTSIVCIGASSTLSESVSGGTWNITNSNASLSGGVITGVSGGLDTVGYSLTNSCGTSTSTYLVTVNLSTDAGTIIGDTVLCVSSSTTLSETVSGGVWSASNGNVSVSAGVITGLSAGPVTIYYTVTSACGTSTASHIMTISSIADSISGPTSVCVGNSITLSDLITGGSWSVSNSNATISGGILSGVLAGIDTIGYSVTTGCGILSASRVVTINPAASGGVISGGDSICVGSSAYYYESATGGIWSTSSASIATITSSGNLSAVTAGIVTISYNTVGVCGTSYSTKTVTVNITPSSITGLSTLCLGSVITFTESSTGGTWSSTGTSIATISDSGLVTTIAVGSTDINYTLSDGCSATKSISVFPLPNAGIVAGPDSVCAGSTVTMTDTLGGAGTWSSSSSVLATVSSTGLVTAVSGGIDTIKYSVYTSCGTSIAKKVITVNPLPIAGTILGASSVCSGSTITLNNSVSGGSWSATNTDASVSLGNVTGVNAGLDTIVYSVTNLCGSASTTFPLTVNPLPNAGTISIADSLCAGSSLTLLSTVTGGVWNLSDSSIATISLGNLLTGISSGIDSVTYVVSTLCGTASASKKIAILPYVHPISGSTSVCVGASVILTDSSIGTWSSSNTNASVVGGNVTGIVAGNDTISFAASDGCGISSVAIVVNPLPVVSAISGTDSLCISTSITLTDSVVGGSWTSQNGNATLSWLSSTDSVVVTGLFAGIDSIFYSVTNVCGVVTAGKSIKIISDPVVGNITGGNTVCVGATITLSDSVTVGSWSSSNSHAANVDSIFMGITAGNDTVRYTVTNYCGIVSTTKVLAVMPPPNAGAISGNTNICIGYLDTLTDAVSGGLWSSSNSIVTVSVSGVVNAVSTGSDTIYYRIANYCGTDTAKATIHVSAMPNPGTITGADSVCLGSTLTVNDATSSGVWSNSNGLVATLSGNVVTGISVGFDSVMYTVSNVCGDSTAYHKLYVAIAPTANLTGVNYACIGHAPDTLYGTPAGGLWTSSNPSVATVSGGLVTAISPGVDTVYYTVDNLCGSSTYNTTITVYSAGTSPCNDYVKNLAGNIGEVTIFPNPSDGIFAVEFPEHENIATIELFDVVGKQVYKSTKDVINNTLSLEILNLTGGIYTVRIKTDNHDYRKNIIIW